MATRTKDHYQTLGVSENASPDEIKKAYRRLAKQYHPDRNAGDPQAAERFKEISQAYGVLSNPERRAKYDRVRKFGGLGGFADARGGPRSGAGAGNFRFEDLGDLGGLGDIFSSIFDFRRRSGRRPGREPGRDVEYLVEIPFRTAARGGKVAITVPVTEECATCDGSGAAPGSSVKTCEECRGRGTVTFGQGTFSVTRPCPACGGRGEIPSTPCPICGGRGEVRNRRRINVTVPAGVEDGSRVRIRGQGERGPGGGPPGDLLVRFKVKEDPFFTREGLDLVCEVPINLAQSLLGSRVRVRTVDGKRIVLRIPPGTQSDTVFRVKGQGVRRGDTAGDQLVRVTVRVPDEVSEQGRQLIERFAQVEGLRH